MNATNKIDYLEFQAVNPEATKAFFTELLGWKFTDYGPDYTSFDDGRITGGFWRSDRSAKVETGSVLVVIYHSELEVIKDKVVQHGGVITKDIYAFPGGQRFHFTEPSGNEFAVWSE